MHDHFLLPIRFEVGGFRPTLERAQFPSTPSNVTQQFLEIGHNRGLWPSLDSVLSAGSLNDENTATRWGAFCAPGSRYALALKSEW